MKMTKAEAAEGLLRQGPAKVFMVSDGPLMKRAIERGEMYQSSMLAITPISLARKEVGLNTTRLGHIEATQTDVVSRALSDLMDQVWTCANFLRNRVPSFENAAFSGIAPLPTLRARLKEAGAVLDGIL
jgi:hypothetical protein